MNRLMHRRILLGVTGGIAAYKAAELVRRLREEGAAVRVVMTAGAQQFVGPLSFQALSANPVHTDLLDPQAEAAMGHIELARWAELIVIAPASADFLARLSHGLANDLLSTLCLATAAPIAVAPAMNQQMWAAAATQANIQVLKSRAVAVWGPASGGQACGEEGLGRMLEPGEIIEHIAAHFGPQSLAGVRVMITAGPTREAIDPVRFISNRSSGRMGYAVAQAALETGAAVTLVSGPVHLETPAQARLIRVETAEEMLTAVQEGLAETDIFIGVAAVADYRCASIAGQKIKKSTAALTLTLAPTADILGAVAGRPHRPFTVGFAAETENLADHALEKLQRKKLDMIAANQVSPMLGFEQADNELLVLWEGGQRQLGRSDKQTLARQLVALIAERYRGRH
jgi:phosphopantothenoylcysteine decarboxylase/phosphopantothenate--cysteine ligase